MDLFLPIKYSVLIIDDTATNLKLISGLLKDTYMVLVANNGLRGLEIARSHKPDLILLDVMMPEMDGYEVCRALKRDQELSEIPVIFLTSRTDIEDEQLGLSLGAVDFISRPITPVILRSRIKAQIALKSDLNMLRQLNEFLEVAVSHRTTEISNIKDSVVMAMCSLAEVRDTDTGNHLLRTKQYMKRLAEKLCQHPKYVGVLNPQTIEMLYKLAPLHDIGKVGIPDRILLKPGKLTSDEFDVMKKHPEIGREAIVHAEQLLGMRIPFLDLAKDIIYAHHEKWDGSGYPQGLAGDAIPIAGRLMAVADVYDALICRRVYKSPMSHERALDVMREGRGKHFDPDVLDAFLGEHEEYHAIAEEYADSDELLESKDRFITQALA